MSRRTIELIGTFRERLYAGDKTHVYVFDDLAFGEYPVKIRDKRNFFDSVELDLMYKIKADVNGYRKYIDNDRTSLAASIDIYHVEPLIPIQED